MSVNYKRFGKIARKCGFMVFPLVIIGSGTYFYIGTLRNGITFSKESVESFEDFQSAKNALESGEWTQRSL